MKQKFQYNFQRFHSFLTIDSYITFLYVFKFHVKFNITTHISRLIFYILHNYNLVLQVKFTGMLKQLLQIVG